MDFRRDKILNCIGLIQLVKDRSGVNRYDEEIIGMSSDIVIAFLTPPTPDIRVKMSWLKTNFPQGMRYVCVSPVPGGR